MPFNVAKRTTQIQAHTWAQMKVSMISSFSIIIKHLVLVEIMFFFRSSMNGTRFRIMIKSAHTDECRFSVRDLIRARLKEYFFKYSIIGMPI